MYKLNDNTHCYNNSNNDGSDFWLIIINENGLQAPCSEYYGQKFLLVAAIYQLGPSIRLLALVNPFNNLSTCRCRFVYCGWKVISLLPPTIRLLALRSLSIITGVDLRVAAEYF